MPASEHQGAPRKAYETGRYSAEHVAAGLALAVAAIVVSSLFAMRAAPSAPAESRPAASSQRRPPAVFALLWPPLFTALTLAGLRIWSAAPSRRRTRALTLWSLLQGFNALWMALGPRRLGGRTTAAVASVGTAAAFAWQARGIETPPSATSSGWRGIAHGVADELRRRRGSDITVH